METSYSLSSAGIEWSQSSFLLQFFSLNQLSLLLWPQNVISLAAFLQKSRPKMDW